jgi:hypothetical protein
VPFVANTFPICYVRLCVAHNAQAIVDACDQISQLPGERNRVPDTPSPNTSRSWCFGRARRFAECTADRPASHARSTGTLQAASCPHRHHRAVDRREPEYRHKAPLRARRRVAPRVRALRLRVIDEVEHLHGPCQLGAPSNRSSTSTDSTNVDSQPCMCRMASWSAEIGKSSAPQSQHGHEHDDRRRRSHYRDGRDYLTYRRTYAPSGDALHHRACSAESGCPSTQGEARHQASGTRVDGLGLIRLAAQELSGVEALKATSLRVLGLPFAGLLQDSVWMPPEDFAGFQSEIVALRNQSSQLLESLRAVTSPQGETVISVQIPPTRTLKELSETLRILLIGIEHPISVVIGESVEFDGFDSGTNWVDILTMTEAGVTFALSLWWAVLKLEKKRGEVNEQHERARAVTLDNDHTKVIDDTFARILEHTEAEIIKEVLGKNRPEKAAEPEVAAKVMAALAALSTLRKGGGNIVAALTAKPAVREMSAKIQAAPSELPAPPPVPLLPAHDAESTTQIAPRSAKEDGGTE